VATPTQKTSISKVNIPQVNLEDDLQSQIELVSANGVPVRIIGGNTKAFYGHLVDAVDIDVSGHSGIVDYDPAELVITLRAGCKLKEVESLLAEKGQMLGFEPPHFGDEATIGGMVASGLTGPRRAFSGAIRDFILGVKLLNGRGEIVNFGGRVIKNVAGFDVSRLMVGALGTLGVLLEVSIRVIPKFEAEETLVFEHLDAQAHIDWINQQRRLPYPISASVWHQGQTKIRLSGSQQGIHSASHDLGGDKIDSDEIWSGLKEQTHSFFGQEKSIARVSVPSVEPDFLIAESQLIEWGGAQRWIEAPQTSLDQLRQQVSQHHRGTVCAFRGYDRHADIFHRPTDAIMTLHRNLKSSFDPTGMFNPGRLYAGL
jgi:glycolate oxidase FAD binding subunit